MYILITSAVYAETSELVNRMPSYRATKIGGRDGIVGEMQQIPVTILVTGPGMTNTAQAITACIEKELPALILQTGCAGAFQGSSLNIGDIGIASEEIDIQLGIESAVNPFIIEEPPFSIIQSGNRQFKNRFATHRGLSEYALEILTEHKALGWHIGMGPFLTVSTITATQARAESLRKQYHPIMEAMEGVAAAQVATHYKLPFIEIRAVSNIVGKRDLTKWNLPLAFSRCSEAICCLLENFEADMLGH